MSLTSLPVTAADLLQLQLSIQQFQNMAEANAEAALINAGTTTVSAYANQLIAINQPLSQVALAVYATMYNATPGASNSSVSPTTVELQKLTIGFLPGQEAFAVQKGFNPTVFDAEAEGLAIAFGNDTGSIAFQTNFGSLSVSAFAQAATNAIFGTAGTATITLAIQQYANNWINFYTSNGIPGNAHPTAAQVQLAAYGAAWGDAVGLALTDPSGAMLQAQVANALIDIAEGTYVAGSALGLQAQHTALQGETITSPTTNLTTGLDNVVVQANSAVINGTANGSGATFNSLDAINGNGHTGLTFNLNDLGTGGTWTPTNLPSVTISAIQTANLNSGEAVVANVATSSQGWSGLTQLNVNESSSGASSTITALGTTNVTVTDGALAGTTDTVQGGGNVSITATDIAAGSAITVGSINAPTGNVTIKETTDGAGHAAGAIAVTGSATTSAISVTQVLAAAIDTAAAITISDANAASTTQAGTIAAVTIDGTNKGATAATINDNSLNSLTVNDVTGVASTITITSNAAFAATTPTTTLALSLNNNAKSANIVDTNNEYATINITTGAKASTATVVDTGAKTFTVAGSSVLTLTGSNLPNVTSIATSGAAGLIDSDYASSVTLTSVTDSSSGPVTLALNDQVASFSGASATGAEIITITSDALKAVTGNGASTSEIVFNGAASTFTAANTGANVTGFAVLGVGASGSGAFTMNASPFSGFSSIDDQGAIATFTKVAVGTALAIDAAVGGAGITYQTSDSSGGADSVAVTLGLNATRAALLGLPATTGGFTVANLTLEDNGSGGLGTANFTINNATAGSAETITTLNDGALSTLTIAGTGDLSVTSAFNDTAGSLSITDNSTSTAGLQFAGGITDNSLTSVTLAGSNTATMALKSLTDTGASLSVSDSYAGSVNLGTLTAINAGAESFSNTGAGTLTIGNTANTGAALANLTLSGKVAYTATADAVTTGITVGGGSDNANVSFATTGALASGKTDSLTLGNGNNTIVDAAANGTVNIAVGTGQNAITTGTAAANITVGAHAAADAFTVGANASEAILTTIAGAQAIGVRDTVTIGDATTFNATAITSAQVAGAGGLTTTLDGWIMGALAAGGHNAAQHEVDWFVFNGNTYIVEQAAAQGTAFGAGDTLVKLVGTYDLSNGSIAGHVVTL